MKGCLDVGVAEAEMAMIQPWWKSDLLVTHNNHQRKRCSGKNSKVISEEIFHVMKKIR